MNIRDTSSALIELSPPEGLPLFHPRRGNDWKLGGEATAVVIEQVLGVDVMTTTSVDVCYSIVTS